MIDTLHLDFGSNFSIIGYHFVVVRKHLNGTNLVSQDYLLWRSKDGDVYGSRAYFRESEHYRFNININPWRDQKVHCVVKLSIPHLLNITNTSEMGIKELNGALLKLQNKLNQLGLIVDVQKGKIIRIDFFSDIHLPSQKLLGQIINYFQSIKINGAHKEIHQTSITWKQDKMEWGIIVYNKTQEQLAQVCNKKRKAMYTDKLNALLRVELKLLRYTFIQRNLKILYLEELIASLTEAKKFFKRFVGRRLFLKTPPNKIYNENTYFHFLLNHYQNEIDDTRWKTKSFEEYGMQALLQHQDVQEIISTTFKLQDLRISKMRSAKSRLMKKLTEVNHRFKYFMYAKNNNDFSDTYEKLRNTFFEEVENVISE